LKNAKVTIMNDDMMTNTRHSTTCKSLSLNRDDSLYHPSIFKSMGRKLNIFPITIWNRSEGPKYIELKWPKPTISCENVILFALLICTDLHDQPMKMSRNDLNRTREGEFFSQDLFSTVKRQKFEPISNFSLSHMEKSLDLGLFVRL